MNAELSKIRRLRNDSVEFDYEPKRIEEKDLLEKIYEINSNFTAVYELQKKGDIDVETFVKKAIDNIYIVLTMFDEMGVYPDYFYDAVAKMNRDYRSAIGSSYESTLRGDYRLYQELSFSVKLSQRIREGLDNEFYKYEKYPQKDSNDAFLEMVSFFQSYGISYIGTQSDEESIKKQCNKVFSEISFNHISTANNLLNSDFLFEDIEYLARLLFEYISFLTAIGINPKERLDAYIENKAKERGSRTV